MNLYHLLLIDDDPEDAEFFREAVGAISADIRVDYIRSGREAIQRLVGSINSQLPDLIFMDIKMPLMDGWETLRELKRVLAKYALPVVMFSSMSFEHFDVSPADLGVTAFVTKPDSIPGFKMELEKLFGKLS